jgi:hypothetical protein
VVPPHFAAAPLRAAGPQRPITGAIRRGLLGYAAAVVPLTQEGLRALPGRRLPSLGGSLDSGVSPLLGSVVALARLYAIASA